jgi:hypothetical protein
MRAGTEHENHGLLVKRAVRQVAASSQKSGLSERHNNRHRVFMSVARPGDEE